MTREALAQAISDAEPVAPPCLPSAETILDRAAAAFGTTPDVICGPSQAPPVCIARHVTAAVIYSLTDLTHREVGDVIGRDVSTVTRSVNRVQGSPRLRSYARAIRDQLTDEGADDA